MGLQTKREDVREFHSDCIQRFLKSGVSLGVFHLSTGRMVGLCLNMILTPDSKQAFQSEMELQSTNEKVGTNVIIKRPF